MEWDGRCCAPVELRQVIAQEPLRRALRIVQMFGIGLKTWLKRLCGPTDLNPKSRLSPDQKRDECQ